MHKFTVTKEIEFDAGHRVPNHKSKCRNPHGHRYRVIATVQGPLVETRYASDEGMVVDFGDLKDLMMTKIHDVFDHGFVVYDEDAELMELFTQYNAHPDNPYGDNEPVNGWKIIVFPYIPTAENMCHWIMVELGVAVRTSMPGCELVRVEVFETPTSSATIDLRA